MEDKKEKTEEPQKEDKKEEDVQAEVEESKDSIRVEKETKKEKKLVEGKDYKASPSYKKKPKNGKLAFIWILLIVLTISIFTQGFTTFGGSDEDAAVCGLGNEALPIDQAEAITTTFIKTSMIPPGQNVSVGTFESVNGVYKFALTVDGQNFESFVTQDAKWIFPQAVKITGLDDSTGGITQ